MTEGREEIVVGKNKRKQRERKENSWLSLEMEYLPWYKMRDA